MPTAEVLTFTGGYMGPHAGESRWGGGGRSTELLLALRDRQSCKMITGGGGSGQAGGRRQDPLPERASSKHILRAGWTHPRPGIQEFITMSCQAGLLPLPAGEVMPPTPCPMLPAGSPEGQLGHSNSLLPRSSPVTSHHLRRHAGSFPGIRGRAWGQEHTVRAKGKATLVSREGGGLSP